MTGATMRYTIPTLIQQLVDQGVDLEQAATIVALTYPETHGDTFYRSTEPDVELGHAVGVYGLWNALRGDQSDLDAGKVSGDARIIAQRLRLNGGKFEEIVNTTGIRNASDEAIAWRTFYSIRDGGYFQPREVPPDDPKETAGTRMAASIARADGAADYLSTMTPPTFGF